MTRKKVRNCSTFLDKNNYIFLKTRLKDIHLEVNRVYIIMSFYFNSFRRQDRINECFEEL